MTPRTVVCLDFLRVLCRGRLLASFFTFLHVENRVQVAKSNSTAIVLASFGAKFIFSCETFRSANQKALKNMADEIFNPAQGYLGQLIYRSLKCACNFLILT